MAKWILSDDGKTLVHDITGDVYYFVEQPQVKKPVPVPKESDQQIPKLSSEKQQVEEAVKPTIASSSKN